jgi:transposase InsO family protein
MKYEAIRQYSSEHSVRKMCKVLGLKEPGYYQWLARYEKRLEKRKEEGKLAEEIGKIFEANKKIFGYRKMKRELEKKGINLSEYRVRKIMRENGYFPVVVKKYRPAKNGKSDGRYYENKVNQDFTAERPNEVWAGDITYIRTRIGFVYLAAVIDLYNREIVGYSISKTVDSELAKAALGNAIGRVGGKVEGMVFHSDRGCQYSSKAFQEMLETHKLIGSMSAPACPYDNACMESFFSSAKRECIYRKQYDNIDEVKTDMFEYIELFYNRKRMHATLGYLSPVEYRLSKIAA